VPVLHLFFCACLGEGEKKREMKSARKNGGDHDLHVLVRGGETRRRGKEKAEL